LGPGKDAQKAALVGHYQEAWDRARAEPPPPDDPRAALVEEYGWMVEEFRVSVFAQELGTDGPVSAKRLDRKLEALA
jgi:ATP-dependent helicase HrpA